MTITIRNDSVAAVVRGYIVDSRNTIVWLELAPQHPKTIGAIWADLVQQHPWLQLGDHAEKRGVAVRLSGCSERNWDQDRTPGQPRAKRRP